MKQNNKISNKSFLTQETKNGFNFYSKKIQKFKKKEVQKTMKRSLANNEQKTAKKGVIKTEQTAEYAN